MTEKHQCSIDAVQNEDAFAFFEPFLSRNLARFETAGALGDGEGIWVLAKVNGRCTIRPGGLRSGDDSTNDWMKLGAQVTGRAGKAPGFYDDAAINWRTVVAHRDIVSAYAELPRFGGILAVATFTHLSRSPSCLPRACPEEPGTNNMARGTTKKVQIPSIISYRNMATEIGCANRRRSSRMKRVYLLHHTHKQRSGEEDVKLLGVYETKDLARAAKSRATKLPGFSKFRKGFSISEYRLNKDCWTKGFITVYPSGEIEN